MLRPTLRFRVNADKTTTPTAFELPLVAAENVGELKVRVSQVVGPHPSFFLLRLGARPLVLVESVESFASDEATIDVLWETCSHGAPSHPLTGESPCFWDGGAPTGDVTT